MNPAGRPLWQQVTALVSLSTGGAITGFSFVPGAVADLTTPTSMPIRLMALEKSAQPTASDDAMLRSAIVNVANYYLRMAGGKTPAEMEQIIWQQDSVDGADHGPSCAAFASLTLELGAQVVGQQSWVTGGTSYPWPLHPWADVRVDPNPSSQGITSVLQDAQANQRWHPVGDGYQPMPGDWVLFDGHVEVVTKHAGGTLYTIGGDSGPNLSVNAHVYPDPLAAQGVVGFVNNGGLSATASQAPSSPGHVAAGPQAQGRPGSGQPGSGQPGSGQPGSGQPGSGQPGSGQPGSGLAAIPGTSPAGTPQPASARSRGGAAIAATPDGAPATPATAPAPPARAARPVGNQRPVPRRSRPRPGREQAPREIEPPDEASPHPVTDAGVPGTGPALSPATVPQATPGAAAIPGLSMPAHGQSAHQSGPRVTPHRRPHRSHTSTQLPTPAQSPAATGPPSSAQAPNATLPPGGTSPVATPAQQQFIDLLAPGAIAAQRKYGVPAAVTIAQAIEESGWGQSGLATRDHNLFGIKGTGPAGNDMLPTQEFENGQMVNRTAIFRVYHDFAESIDDHGKLLATSGYYRQAMADRLDPNKFAASLTGIYATDPQYGAKLIGIMQQYNLYRYEVTQPATAPVGAVSGGASIPGLLPRTAPAPSVGPSDQVEPVGPSHHVRSARPAHHMRPARTRQPAGSAPAPQPFRPAPAPTPTHTPQPLQPAPTPEPFRPSPSPRPARSRSATPTRGGPPARSRPRSQPILAQLVSVTREPTQSSRPARSVVSRVAGASGSHYHHHLPLPVRNAFLATARGPITFAKPLYSDVASHTGMRWELLAACDWMQCEARPRYSPVHGEKLGTLNPDGTIYHTKSEALEQCAEDLVNLARAVYQVDVTADAFLSVRDLANVFAAFRWGGLLKLHRTSAMEFPYSVAGLSNEHINMRWPNIDEPNTPDKPGARFHRPFGAVPVVLGLNYPAIA